MRYIAFTLTLILIAGGTTLGSFGASNKIPLPGSKDIEKYFMENINRFRIPFYDPEIELDIMRIESLPCHSIFSKHRIFQVKISRPYLEIIYPGTFISNGYFATGGKEILYLNRSNRDNIETLFKNENIQIDELDATTFCLFLSQTLLTDGARSYRVISSVSEIIDFAQSEKGYEVNDPEITKFENDIHPPKISGDRGSGWEIEFYTFGGWMHKVTKVARHLFEISDQYKIRHTQEVLTTQVFSKIPRIVY
jgi:hypothetical protein